MLVEQAGEFQYRSLNRPILQTKFGEALESALVIAEPDEPGNGILRSVLLPHPHEYRRTVIVRDSNPDRLVDKRFQFVHLRTDFRRLMRFFFLAFVAG